MKLIIFEYIDKYSLSRIKKEIEQKNKVLYFEYHNDENISNFLKNEHIKPLSWEIFGTNYSYFTYHQYEDKVIEYTDKYVETILKNRLVYKLFRQLYNDEIATYFKKSLSLKFSKYFLLNIFINEYKKYYDKIEFIGDEYLIIKNYLKQINAADDMIEDITFIKNHKNLFKICHPSIVNFNYIIFLILKFIKLLFYNHHYKKNSYKLGIRIYKTDFSFRENKKINIDFLIDENLIKSKDVLFLIETEISVEYYKKLKEKGYNFVDVSKLKTILNISDLLKLILYNIILFIYIFDDNYNILLIALKKYRKWKSFLNQFNIEKHICYNHTDSTHILRNILFSKNNIKTYFFTHSAHNRYVFELIIWTKRLLHNFYAFYFYDNFISYNNIITEYYKSHKNRISNYHNLGCLWSEHVKEYQNSNRLEYELPADKKIIALFDTTFGWENVWWGKGFILADDLIKFNEDMIKLANEHNNFFFIYKMKNNFDEIKQTIIEKTIEDVKNSYKKIKNCENFKFIEADYYESSEIIANSDLTISIPFTSTTNEALGASRKAIFYDPSGKYKDTYYNHYPKLVANGYDELKKLVNYWLNISDEEFQEYLDKVIKPNIDPYCDGNAITRFRKLLI